MFNSSQTELIILNPTGKGGSSSRTNLKLKPRRACHQLTSWIVTIQIVYNKQQR